MVERKNVHVYAMTRPFARLFASDTFGNNYFIIFFAHSVNFALYAYVLGAARCMSRARSTQFAHIDVTDANQYINKWKKQKCREKEKGWKQNGYIRTQ